MVYLVKGLVSAKLLCDYWDKIIHIILLFTLEAKFLWGAIINEKKRGANNCNDIFFINESCIGS